jgi:hypothetical protein
MQSFDENNVLMKKETSSIKKKVIKNLKTQFDPKNIFCVQNLSKDLKIEAKL